MAEFGYHMTDEQALEMRSLGRPFASMRLKAWFGEKLDYEAVRKRRKELMMECLDSEGILRKPGARTMLQYLREKKIMAAVATATDMERTREYLKITGLYPYFESIIRASMVDRGKPAPDIYLYACKSLELEPGDCIAVEDSPNGVISAWRAGCRVIMVPDQTQPEEYLRKCLYACAESLGELPSIL